MTNFERFKEDLTQEQFIDIVLLNCEECTVKNCMAKEFGIIEGGDCEEVLIEWCERTAE